MDLALISKLFLICCHSLTDCTRYPLPNVFVSHRLWYTL